MSEWKNIWAVIPALNCQATVGQIVTETKEVGLQVIVVDDGSSDETARVAESAGATVLKHPSNLGKGHALATGITQALAWGAQAVATLDADGQHDPADLPSLITRLDSADMIIGKRELSLKVMPLTSFIGNSISTFFISFFCKETFPDTQCGLRVYSRRMLDLVPLHGGRFDTETELLMRASLLGLFIDWVPIRTLYDTQKGPRKTHFNNFYDTLRIIRMVLGSFWFPRK